MSNDNRSSHCPPHCDNCRWGLPQGGAVQISAPVNSSVLDNNYRCVRTDIAGQLIQIGSSMGFRVGNTAFLPIDPGLGNGVLV